MKYVIASDIHGSAYYCRLLKERFAEEEAQKVTREKEERLEKMQGELQQFQQNVDQLRAQLKETLEWMDRKLERLGMLPQQEAALEPEEEKHTFAPFHLDQNFR